MLKTGKLPNELLQEIVLRHLKSQRPEVMTRSGVGEDCAVIDFGGYDCHISTDPITASSTGIGSLAVHISCNDIASNGVAPLGIMLTLLLPEGTTESEVEEIMIHASEAASHLNVEIIGGHTEITPAVNKPVIVSTAIGRAPKPGFGKYLYDEINSVNGRIRQEKAVTGKDTARDRDTGRDKDLDRDKDEDRNRDTDRDGDTDRDWDTDRNEDSANMTLSAKSLAELVKAVMDSSEVSVDGKIALKCQEEIKRAVLSMCEYTGNKVDIHPGDVLYMTKTAGLEGTAIIAADFYDALTNVLSQDELSKARCMLNDVSVVYEGLIAGILGFTAMHDVTEGGLLGALWELCQINAVGAIIYENQIPIEDVTHKICDHFKIDALRLISSGAMLIAISEGKSKLFERFMSITGIRLSRIGEITDAGEGIRLVSKIGEVTNVAPPESDEIYKLSI